ncbi:MAG: XRE family transcriptional regulator [Chloracidobacterium sp.]|nr:XRE family transcriptional regulator [Chloracidobacterium sp.]
MRVGSGNVFADLGLAEADELLVKARLTQIVNEEIKRQNLTQAEAARILRVNQSEVSRLMRSFGSFSPTRLMIFLNRLGRNVEIIVPPARRSKKPAQTLVKEA